MTDRFSEEAAGWDDKPGNRERAQALAAVVRAEVPLPPGARVLEIGGGTGLLARALADDIGSALVTDAAPGMVAAAREALADPRFGGWAAQRYDIERDVVLEERFDLVLGLLALHHMGDIALVVARCAELLVPGGHVALIDLDRDDDGSFHAHLHDFDGHDGFGRERVREWLAAAGLVEVRVTDAGTVTKETEHGVRDFPMFLAVGRRG